MSTTKKVAAAAAVALVATQGVAAHADDKKPDQGNKPAATQAPKQTNDKNDKNDKKEEKKKDQETPKPAVKAKVAQQVKITPVGAGYDADGAAWYGPNTPLKVALSSSDGNPIGNARVTAQKVSSSGNPVGGQVEVFRGAVPDTAKEFTLPDMSLKSGERVAVTVAPENRQPAQTMLGFDSEAPAAPSMSLITSGGVTHGDTTFFQQEDVQLRLARFADEGAGVKTVSLERSDDNGKTWKEYRTVNGAENYRGTEWHIQDSGTYRFRVVDNLGNSNTYGLHDLYDGIQDKIEVKATSKPGAVDFGVNGQKPHDGWYKDSAVVDVTVKSTGFWNSSRITVNGQEAVGNKIGSGDRTEKYTIDLSKFPTPSDGTYNIDVHTLNMFQRDTISHKVKADFEAPTAKLWLESESGNLENGTWYTPKAPVFGIDAHDEASGVKSVTLSYEDFGGNKKTLNIPVGERSVKLDSSGRNFTLTVEDHAGHVTTTPLGGNVASVDYDTQAPTIGNVTDPKTVDYSGAKWLTSRDGALGFSIPDNDLSRVDAYINGQKVQVGRDGNRFTIDLAQANILNGKIELSVTATDKAGNSTDLHRVWMVDSEAPSEIRADVHGDVQVTPWGAYAKTMPTMQVTAVDNGSGVAKYQLLDGSGNVTAESGNGFFTSIPAGTTQVRVIDNVGHPTLVPLSKITPFSQAPVIDPNAPAVKINRPEAQHNNWYANDFTLSADATDNASLKSAQLYVNGVLVSQFEARDAAKSANLSVDTSKLGEPKDGKYSVRVVATDAAGNVTESTDEFNIDRVNPEVVSFNFDTTGPQPATASEDYGVFVSSSTGVNIIARDPGASSGVRSITYTLRNADGSINRQETVNAVGGSAYVTFPADFKGYVDAVATDNVGRKSSSVHPYGIVSETSNWHANTAKVAISTPETSMSDAQGTPLYDRATTATYNISSPVAGIKKVTYGIGSKTLGELSPEQLQATSRDKNLVTGATGTFNVGDEGNGQKLWVRVVDNVGHESFTEKNVSVDTTAPKINVEYSDAGNPVMRDGVAYYRNGRTAKIRIVEKNFDPNKVSVRGATLNGSWVNTGNDTWENTATFNEDGTYEWSVEFTDRAGHAAQPYNSGKFIVDKTAPVVNVDWSDNNGTSDGWYRTNRSATVTVKDAHFDPSGAKFDGNGRISAFNKQGDTWVATVTWDEKYDGDREFNLSATDIAGNPSATYNSGKFKADTTPPTVKIEGVQNGVIYKEKVAPRIVVDEKNIDLSKSTVVVKSRSRGELKLEGALQPGKSTLSLQGMGDGKDWDDLYTVEAKIVDKSGQTTTQESQYIVNRYGSQFDFKDFNFKGKYVKQLKNDIVITQTSVERIDPKKIRPHVLRDGANIPVNSDAYNVKESGGDKSNWTYTITISKDLYNSHDGAYSTRLTSTTETGKEENTFKQEHLFGIDNTAPDILISGVVERGSYHAPEGSKKVTVQVHELSGVDKINIKLNGKEVESEHTEGTDEWSVIIPASSNAQDLDVEVVDMAGNRSSEHVGEFHVTADLVEAIVNSNWIQYVLWALAIVSVVGLPILWLWLRRKKKEKEMRESTREALKAGAFLSTTGARGTGSQGASAGSTADGSAYDDTVVDAGVDSEATTVVGDSDGTTVVPE